MKKNSSKTQVNLFPLSLIAIIAGIIASVIYLMARPVSYINNSVSATESGRKLSTAKNQDYQIEYPSKEEIVVSSNTQRDYLSLKAPKFTIKIYKNPAIGFESQQFDYKFSIVDKKLKINATDQSIALDRAESIKMGAPVDSREERGGGYVTYKGDDYVVDTQFLLRDGNYRKTIESILSSLTFTK